LVCAKSYRRKDGHPNIRFDSLGSDNSSVLRAKMRRTCARACFVLLRTIVITVRQVIMIVHYY